MLPGLWIVRIGGPVGGLPRPVHRIMFMSWREERVYVYVCRAYFASSAWIFGFFMLALGIESASLRDGRFDHPHILVNLSKTRQISFDMKRDRIHATYTDS